MTSEQSPLPPLRFALSVVLSAISLTFALQIQPASAQQPEPTQTAQSNWPFRFDLFHMLLEQRGLRPSGSLVETLRRDPSDAVIVLVGDLTRMPAQTWPHVATFLRRGGSILIASDRTVDAQGLLVIEPGPVTTHIERFVYQGHTDCPTISHLDSTHALMRGVTRIVANRCGMLARIWKQNAVWEMPARLPHLSRLNGSDVSGRPLVGAMEVNEGRIAAVADHSLFINGMLWHGDNARFALNMTDWLTQDGRSELVFIADGNVFDGGLQPPSVSDEDLSDALPDLAESGLPDIPEDSLLEYGNAFLSTIEDADLHNELAAGQPREIDDRTWRQLVYLGLALIAALVILKQLMRHVPRFERPFSRTPLSAAGDRYQSTLQSGEFLPAVRELAQDLYRTITGSENPRQWAVDPGDIEVSGSYLQRRAARSDLLRLRRIAVRADRRQISGREFQNLAGRICRLLELHQQGRLRHPPTND